MNNEAHTTTEFKKRKTAHDPIKATPRRTFGRMFRFMISMVVWQGRLETPTTIQFLVITVHKVYIMWRKEVCGY